MPISPQESSPAPQTTTATHTQTSINTKTKVVAATVGFLALGLAAYGFGFIPGLDTEQTQQFQKDGPQQQEMAQEESSSQTGIEESASASAAQPLDCLMTCEADHRACIAYSTPLKCDDALHECELACPRGDVVASPESTSDNPAADSSEYMPPGSPTPPAACLFTVEHTSGIGQSSDETRTLLMREGWQTLNRYMFNAGVGEDVVIRQIGLTTQGDFRHFDEIGIMRDGILIGRIPAAGLGPVRNLPFFEELRIPAGTSVNVQLVARLAPFTTNPTANNPLSSFTSSGDRVSLGIGSGNTDGMWSRGYDNNYQIDAECTPSLVHVYAVGSSNPYPFVLRKSQLRLTQEPLSSTTLGNGRQFIYRFQAQTEGGNATIKKLVWNYKYQGFTSDTYFGDVRLYRGASEIPQNEYRITDQFGRDVRNLPLSPNAQEGILMVTFTDEETVREAGQLYALSAQSRNPQVGTFLQLIPSPDLRPGVDTGYLTAVGPRGSFNGIGGPTIDENEPADGIPDAGSNVIWSDGSAVPHSFQEGQSDGSRDWIAGTTDNGLVQQILSR